MVLMVKDVVQGVVVVVMVAVVLILWEEVAALVVSLWTGVLIAYFLPSSSICLLVWILVKVGLGVEGQSCRIGTMRDGGTLKEYFF